MIFYDELLTPFLSKDPLRPDLNVPTTQTIDDTPYVFATDVHHIIRIPQSHCMNAYAPQAKHNFQVIWPSGERLRATPLAISAAHLREAIEQVPLENIYETLPCPKCDGEGSIECPCCEATSDCKECDGDGVKKGKLLGTQREEYPHVSIRNIHFNARLLTNLLSVGEALGEPILLITDHDQSRIAVFAIGDIRVGIMPMMHTPSTESIVVKI